MNTGTTLKKARGFLSLLRKDESGNVLAMVAAGVFPLIAMAGGAADMSRAYMTRARMQQACDAGALAARRAMTTGTLTTANKNTGYRFFDFNFPAGSYGSTLTKKEYIQPVVGSVTQTTVRGDMEATVPTMLMQVFGKDTLDIDVSCTSTQDVTNADVAMVLDVTYSMDDPMKITATGTTTEPRIAALRKAVKAFYNSLGPGSAGGDSSKGRIRYAFIPYGTTVNNAYLMTNNHLVDSWVYQSRLAVARNYWGWVETGSESGYTDGPWSPTSPLPTNTLTVGNYNSFSTVSGTGNQSITNADGSTSSLAKTISNSSATCNNANTLATGIAAIGNSFGTAGTTTLVSASVPVGLTAAQRSQPRTRSYDQPRTVTPTAYRYSYTSSACRLQSASAKSAAQYTQARGRTTTRPLSWTNYVGSELVYGAVNTNVSSLKAGGSNWNQTFTLPLSISGSNTYTNIKLSGQTTNSTFTLGTPVNNTVTFLGCTEDRTTDTSINEFTAVGTVPSGAIDLQFSTLASTGDNNTRWKPYLHNMVFRPSDGQSMSGSDILDNCPTPALKLHEYATYKGTISTTYPNLFTNSPAITSRYYPRQASSLLNQPTLENYIERIKRTNGTVHDVGFMWGMHVLSGVGMFASENPDFHNSVPVSRNIVFMTDGEMNPGPERYMFHGYNDYDGRLSPAGTADAVMIKNQNRRLRIMCEEAKRQGITVWVVAITDATAPDYTDLKACASDPDVNFKTAGNSTDLINSFTTIAQSIGGLRISE